MAAIHVTDFLRQRRENPPVVDRGAYRYKATRDVWVNTCKGCHSPRFARDHLNAMDEAVKLSFTKYREAMGILMALYADNLIDPMPIDLAPDSRGHNVFSLMPGKGEMRKYNVSNIERLTYEMLVDIIGAIFKAKTHNAYYSPIYGYWEWALCAVALKIAPMISTNIS